MLSLDIAFLKHGYETGTLKPEAVLDMVYDRIAARGERPVWITLVPKAAALAQLAAAPRGPLWGIPFAVKDNIDAAGLPTTAACPAFAYTPRRSAGVVERLQAAGAILIGKTNMDQFATGLVGTRSPYGICASVFSADHISGGSSSGSGVAVGAGLVAFALGTDTAGSGRVPAAFNNVVGLKPTRGLISTRGVVPACRSLDCVSVFAGTVADALAVLEAAASYDAEDAFSRRPQPAAPLPERVRFGVPAALEFFGDDAAAALFKASVERLTALGGEAVVFDFQPFRDAASLLYAGPWVAERLAAIGDFARQQPEAVNEVVRDIILGGGGHSAVDAFKAQYRLAELVRAAEAEWAKMDVMVLPTAPTIYRIDEVLADPVRLNSNLGTYTNFVNLMDLAAIAIPAGFRPDGLPFGVTLVARAFQDGALAVLADALHRALPGACIGASDVALAATPPARIQTSADCVRLAVVGAHLTGQPLHGQLTQRNARLVSTTRTAPGYSLYALKGTQPAKPGLVCDGAGAGGIEVEVYEMDLAGFGSFVALVPSPLCIGTVTLADGSEVKGFLCEGRATADALDITGFGGWRSWLASRPGERPL
ncbi:allophanate hydrolase [Blastochloris viridis]|uniref:Allophanate hydrolase n=1 Tax=Blastochloris viridis TaxID=1079 RepID=A0A0H5BPC9_BLAVI|nr:allophanate hydrolase [Blastochloris viridis]ALK10925.1 Allophanate hydrolase [Blastochloris viridis]BAR99093.1 allophanate hydrolase [Blastochloris viridis]CUU43587.1 Glutamyl-tRNA(Gln) amidotransferase subunit A [Blastochloris viridis]